MAYLKCTHQSHSAQGQVHMRNSHLQITGQGEWQAVVLLFSCNNNVLRSEYNFNDIACFDALVYRLFFTDAQLAPTQLS